MSKIVTLSFLIAKSLYKEKASYLFGVLAGVIMLLSLALGGTRIGEKYKLFEDILLTSQGYFFIVAALFYGFLQLSRDRSLGLFVLPLGNGMSRDAYLLSQMFASVWMMTVLFILFFLLDTVMIFFVEGSVYPGLLWQLFLYFLSAQLVAFFVMTLALYVSLTNAALYALVLFFIGNALDELFVYANFIAPDPLFGKAAWMLYYLFPNFSLFDLQGVVVNRRSVELWSGVMLPLFYFVIWAGICFLASLSRFQKKALTLGD